ncbi:WD40 repeat-like protein [Xylariaceae sp. FL0255]|nr:WD40 repeat-like protein [Xylariaceae sp. FL0255]
MDDFDRDSNATSDNERDHDDDLTMHDVDGDEENDNVDHDHDDDDDNEADVDNDIDDNNDNDNDNEDDDDDDQDQHQDTEDLQGQQKTHSATPGDSSNLKWQPVIRPEYLTAKTYDIVPTMAAPMATSVNAIAITPDLRYWMTGGTDGYIRKYDGPATINGKTLLTVAQRHPFVDSVTKAGVLMSYWENAEPQSPAVRQEDLVLSPVYSLAVQSQALWLLSGLESGGINLQSVRHDEGKRITCLQKHTNAVSALTLAADEKSVLSGSWDKNIFDWDLNTGYVSRQFDGRGQISAIEIRPMGGAPVPPEASEEEIPSDTFFSSNGLAATDDINFKIEAGLVPENGLEPNGIMVNGNSGQMGEGANDMAGAPGSPSHDSLFGGSPGGGSDLFGDNDGLGFGGDDDNEFSRAMMQDSAQDNLPMGDYSMPGTDFDSNNAASSTLPPPSSSQQHINEAPTDSSNATLSGPTMIASDEFTSVPTTSEMTTQPAGDGSFSMDQSGTMGVDLSLGQNGEPPRSPSTVFAAPPVSHHDTTQTSDSTFLSASFHGTICVWDRRAPNPIARIGNRPGVPPWCMGACWSPDGNWIYAGRRNGTVEEFSVQKARGGRAGWQPERVFKFPGGSGPVSCVRPMANGRHLVCASHDILRLYDLRADASTSKHAPPPFLIIPGPPRAGVISSLYVDASSRFMLSAAGNRGWEGSSTEVLIGYEINVPG